LGLLRVSGADALGFLQGQLSNDTRRLGNGMSLLAAYSNPQGRVLAVMHLLPHSSGVIAILPRELLAETRERLQKFVLRAKVQLEVLGEQLELAGQQDAAALRAAGIAVPPREQGYLETQGVGVAGVAPDGQRYWVVGAPGALTERGLAGDSSRAERIELDWRLADIRAGLPQIYAATREMFVAQMLNLDLIDGISFSKGCFTGQEIIARTQHLGRIKRRLHRLRLPQGDWRIGQSLTLSDGRGGRLTEVVRAGEDYEALAVLAQGAAVGGATDPADAGQRADAPHAPVGATELPLPYPLAQVASDS
jgi:folate-binding protein YgfZ